MARWAGDHLHSLVCGDGMVWAGRTRSLNTSPGRDARRLQYTGAVSVGALETLSRFRTRHREAVKQEIHTTMLTLEPLSFGIGDRFAHQAAAQLRAFQQLAEQGVHVTPVWNKSNREHNFVGSEPQSVYDAAKLAVEKLGWSHPWHVDADHIQLATVERFLGCSDFFTIDVADFINKPASDEQIDGFEKRHPELNGVFEFPGLKQSFTIDRSFVRRVARKYLVATRAAGEILSAHRPAAWRRESDCGSVDGRDGRSADTTGTAGDSGGTLG